MNMNSITGIKGNIRNPNISVTRLLDSWENKGS